MSGSGNYGTGSASEHVASTHLIAPVGAQINLYAQDVPGHEAYVVGTSEALMALADALVLAAEQTQPVDLVVQASDGEWYTLKILPGGTNHLPLPAYRTGSLKVVSS
ncbi:MAG: hypothetical protein ACYDAZ_08700 [Thermoplasmataceae archaeon]